MAEELLKLNCMKKIVLLLTACINPHGMKYTMLQDVEERKRQYKWALDYYLAKTKYRIVFCENTGADLSELKNKNNDKRVEFLSFEGNNYDSNLGKGYGEYIIIQYAFENSHFLKNSSLAIKITGRLCVENLVDVIKWQNRVFGKQKSALFAIGNPKFNWLNSRFFMASKDFFVNYFLKGKNTIDDSKGYYFEHYLCDVTNKLPYDFIVSDFVIPVSIIGQSGTSGDYYEGIDTVRYEKLRIIRDFCQWGKMRFKKTKPVIYYRMCVVSFFVRLEKAICRRVSSIE